MGDFLFQLEEGVAVGLVCDKVLGGSGAGGFTVFLGLQTAIWLWILFCASQHYFKMTGCNPMTLDDVQTFVWLLAPSRSWGMPVEVGTQTWQRNWSRCSVKLKKYLPSACWRNQTLLLSDTLLDSKVSVCNMSSLLRHWEWKSIWNCWIRWKCISWDETNELKQIALCDYATINIDTYIKMSLVSRTLIWCILIIIW